MFNMGIRFKDCPKCGTKMDKNDGAFSKGYTCPKCKYSESTAGRSAK